MRLLAPLFLLAICLWSTAVLADAPASIPILTYHNFDPSIPGSMTISTRTFENQLQWLKNNGYTVVPLMQVVDYLQGKRASLPAKAVVITADDGRKSVYQYMLPLARKYHIPVTLFIYPSSISNANYALTWQQLKELQQTGLFDIQGHTYWHPDFKQEKHRLSAQDYDKLVDVQLVKSRQLLDKKLDTHVTLLAWPYGIYDRYLEQQAAHAGYTMAFSIDDRSAAKNENTMAMPRYMIAERHGMKTFAEIVDGTIERAQTTHKRKSS